MQKIVVFVLFLIVTGYIPSCKSQPEKESKRNIILDVDMSVDDMLSILYFLSCPDIDIKAITIENGVSTVDSGAEIVLRILNLTGHPEIPVAKGTGKPLEGDNAFPEQWRPPVDKPFGLALPAHHLIPSDKSAVTLIKQIAGENKNNLTIMALGPMTNLAQVFLDRLGVLARQVIAELLHDLPRIRVNPAGFQPGAVGIEPVAAQAPQEGLGHLAAGGIGGAQEQHADFVHKASRFTRSAR